MSIPSILEYRILDARVRDPSVVGNSGTNGITPIAPPPLTIIIKGATGIPGMIPSQVDGTPGSLPINPLSTHTGSTGLGQLDSAASPGQDGVVGLPALPALQGVVGNPYTYPSAYASGAGGVGITVTSGIATINSTGWYEIVQNGQFYIPILVTSTYATTRIFNADGIVSGNSQVWNGKLYAGDKVMMPPSLQITRIA